MQYKGCCVAILLTTLLASHQAAAEYEAHSAHVHGQGQLEVLKQGTEVQINFYAPGTDLLGFERQPADAAEAEKVNKVRHQLLQGAELFKLSGTGCQLSKAETSLTLVESSPASADHDHDHKHGSGEKAGFSDINSSYSFQCAEKAELELTTQLFSLFPSLQQLQVSWISDTQQSAKTLTPKDPQLVLK